MAGLGRVHVIAGWQFAAVLLGDLADADAGDLVRLTDRAGRVEQTFAQPVGDGLPPKDQFRKRSCAPD